MIFYKNEGSWFLCSVDEDITPLDHMTTPLSDTHYEIEYDENARTLRYGHNYSLNLDSLIMDDNEEPRQFKVAQLISYNPNASVKEDLVLEFIDGETTYKVYLCEEGDD